MFFISKILIKIRNNPCYKKENKNELLSINMSLDKTTFVGQSS